MSSNWAFSQLYKCPLKQGIISHPKLGRNSNPDYTTIRLLSKHKKVISISEGFVTKISLLNSNYIVFIRNERDEFFIYSDLNKIYLKVGDKIKVNQKIGNAMSEDDGNSYTFSIQHYDKTEPTKIEIDC